MYRAYQPVRTIWAIPRASLRSVLFGIAPIARLCLARLDTDRHDPRLRKALMQPGRQRARLQANPFHYQSASPKERDQRLWLACGTRLAHDQTAVIDNANRGPLPTTRPIRQNTS